jgi:hypothetical protein
MIGDRWNLQETPVNGDYRKIAFGNGIFVALDLTKTNNNLLTSYDGINWKVRVMGLKSKWHGICFGGGKFVVVSSETNITYQVANSYDGINWTFHESANNDMRWFDICYGGDQYVAVAWNDSVNCVMTSPDGETWTQRTGIVDNYWTCVEYGNGIYVALASFTIGSGTLCMTSPDGITWTERDTGITFMGWADIAYGNGVFIAVGDAPDGKGNKIGRSTNGINWNTIIASGDAGDSWNGVIFAEDLFISVSAWEVPSQVMVSSDLGLTWKRVTQPGIKTWRSICYGLNMFVAVASTGYGSSQNNLIMTSIDDTEPLNTGITKVSRFVDLQLEKL